MQYWLLREFLEKKRLENGVFSVQLVICFFVWFNLVFFLRGLGLGEIWNKHYSFNKFPSSIKFFFYYYYLMIDVDLRSFTLYMWCFCLPVSNILVESYMQLQNTITWPIATYKQTSVSKWSTTLVWMCQIKKKIFWITSYESELGGLKPSCNILQYIQNWRV